MKKTALILAAAMLLCIFTGCSAQKIADSTTQTTTRMVASATASTAADSITVTDHGGVTVTIPKDVQRIAICGIYPLASVLTLFFNSADKIVAMPKPSLSAAQNGLLGQLYPEILDVETECVSGDVPNTEELMKLEPDVVFYSQSDTACGEALRNAGFNTVGIAVNQWGFDALETLNAWIELLDQIFPGNERASKCAAAGEEIYTMVQERVGDIPEEERARVFVMFQYNESTLMTSGKNFFGEWWCEAVGAVNVAAELDAGSTGVNLEQVYQWNPDTILITNFTSVQPDNLYAGKVNEDDWSGIDAVQNGRVYKMPLGMYRSYTPGGDAPVTLLWIAKTVYPDLFEDVNVTEWAKKYYLDVFDVELTDEQAESIFQAPSAAAEGF